MRFFSTLIPSILVMAAVAHAADQTLPRRSIEAAPGQAVGMVTITNLTKGQIFAPAVVVTHAAGQADYPPTGPLSQFAGSGNVMMHPLFTPGKPASNELAMLAEEGRGDPLKALLMTDPRVLDVQIVTGAGGPIMPGETVSAEILFDLDHQFVSLAAMLVTTNDGFIALRDGWIPIRGGAVMYMADVWDAGSEANTEDCMHIPGPPCGTHDGRMQEGAEGYVHIHNGIHGIGGVSAAGYDWRNPAAEILITGLGRLSRPAR